MNVGSLLTGTHLPMVLVALFVICIQFIVSLVRHDATKGILMLEESTSRKVKNMK
jgi:hypothetical protein